MEERSEWGSSLSLTKRGRSVEQWKKRVATGGNFSCKSSTMDALRLNNEIAAGTSKEEDNDEKKTKAEKVKPKKDAGETMEEEESTWVTGDGLNEEYTGSVHPEKSGNSETV